MRIAFDIDNVLADIVSSARAALASDLGLRTDEVILTHIYHQPFWHDDPVVASRMILDHSFWDRPDVLNSCPVIPGAVDAVRRVAAAGRLAGYITRRPDAVRDETLLWMRSSEFADAPIHHVGTTDALTTYDMCKSTVCHMIGATHLVDDHATELAKARSAGIEVVVVDADIGRAAREETMALHPGTILARDAAHAVDILLAMDPIAS